jgi:hypothetical protein
MAMTLGSGLGATFRIRTILCSFVVAIGITVRMLVRSTSTIGIGNANSNVGFRVVVFPLRCSILEVNRLKGPEGRIFTENAEWLSIKEV